LHIEYLRERTRAAPAGKWPINTPYKATLPCRNMLSKDMQDELTSLFRKYEKLSVIDGQIHREDMLSALTKIGLNYKPEKFEEMFKKADENQNDTLELQEFLDFFNKYIINGQEALPWESVEGADDDDDDDEMPDEFKDLSPAEQRRAILKEACYQMLFGTALVLIFSDPMVDVLAQIGKMTGVPAFYVSFVLGPLASNASELVASFKLAAKKSSESITQSLQTLEGAAIMNNTFCLGIFYILIYMQGLAWKFTAETLSIVLVQMMVGMMVLHNDKQTMLHGIIVFLFYPLSLVFVYFLEAHGID